MLNYQYNTLVNRLLTFELALNNFKQLTTPDTQQQQTNLINSINRNVQSIKKQLKRLQAL